MAILPEPLAYTNTVQDNCFLDVGSRGCYCTDEWIITPMEKCKPIICNMDRVCKKIILDSICVFDHCQCDDGYYFNPERLECRPHFNHFKWIIPAVLFAMFSCLIAGCIMGCYLER